MISKSATRVSDQTTHASNERIRRQMEASIAYYAQHHDLIGRRLLELDQEWDIERVLETGSSTLTLTGLLMSITSSRKWLLLSFVVQGFFMQHAMQGWCPPLPVFRRLGIRTPDEINRERYALKALRGDFRDGDAAGEKDGTERALHAVTG